jgi:hypothetical protein
MMPSDLTPPKAFPVLPRNSGGNYLDFSGGQAIPWLDFSGWLEEHWFNKPGNVIGHPQKGHPVEAPGNPEGQQSGVQSQIGEGLKEFAKFFVPSDAVKRDFLVYGLALIVFVIAVASILR